jgi:hypothetical protein
MTDYFDSTIDRWFAIWQRSHPQSWFRDRNMAARPLIPFRNPANQGSNPYWTSDTSISPEAFGYTYPELVGNPNPAAVQKRWGDQYGWARRLTPQANPNVKPLLPEFEPLNLSNAQVFQGIREFKPLTRNVQLLPAVRNLEPQPLRRAMAAPAAATAQAPLAKAAAPQPLSALAASVASHTAAPIVMMAHAVGLEAPQAIEKAATAHHASKSTAPVTASASSVEAAEAAAPAPAPAPKALASHVKSDHVHSPTPSQTTPAHAIDEQKVSREWYIDDLVARLALNTSFTILYFIGAFEPSDSLVGLMMAPTFVGLNHVFAAPIEACDNCEQQEGVAHMVRSTSPITSMLLDYVGTGELGSMRPEHVRGFLVRNLKWRVVTVSDRV